MLTAKSFQDWQSTQLSDPEFVAENHRLELGYQIARLRLLREITQAQLAEMDGGSQSYLSHLENSGCLPRVCYELLNLVNSGNGEKSLSQ